MFNKRYKDIFAQYIYKEEKTPFTIGTMTIVAACFLSLIIATFTQLNFSFPKFDALQGAFVFQDVNYGPLIPAMMFSIYILGKNYAFLLFIIYIITGFFIWPIFGFGGGIDYVQNYLFGYILGFVFAIIISGGILKKSQDLKSRLWCAIWGVTTIHITGFLYSIVLALFKVIEFNMVLPIVSVISFGKIIYDIICSVAILAIGPYIKNILWICMKPKPDRIKLKNSRIRADIISNNID